MKLLKCTVLFMLMNSLLFSQVSRYEEVSVLGEKVYFPKKTSEYLLELLESEGTDSYYEIAKAYITLNEFTAAENFLKQYEAESDNYKKIAELYHLMGNYSKEIESIEKYLENPFNTIDKLTYYDYIAELITDKNLNISLEKYNLSKLDRLKIYIDTPDEYYNYFVSQEWSSEEKEEIIKELISNNKTSSYFDRILDKIASLKQLEKIYFEKIKFVSDTEAYYKYFSLMEQNSSINSFRNEFEKLHYLRYKQDLTTDFYKDKLAYDFAMQNDLSNLKKLYSVEPDFKLMYNLAQDDDKIFYKFIIKQKNEGIKSENIIKLLAMFDEKFPDSKYSDEILKLKLEYTESEEEKLELLNVHLQENTEVSKNIDFILMKLNILLGQGNQILAEELVSELIFSSYENSDLIKFYSSLLEKTGRVEELINNLMKLNNKSFYFEKCIDYSIEIDKMYEDLLINYYFEKGEYQNLLEYKDKLTYEMYDELLKSGWLEFLEAALTKYSLKEEWVDKTEFKYFYFNKNYGYFDESKVAEIFEKDKRTDAETYYLAKHYEVIGDFEKSSELLEELENEYILTEI